MDPKEWKDWQSVLHRATEDTNLSLALRQACRSALDELTVVRDDVTRLQDKCSELRIEIAAVRKMSCCGVKP